MTVSVNGAEFATITAAMAAMQNGQTIMLDTDVVEDVEVYGGRNIRLDLNGHKLSAQNKATITVLPGGTVAICDLSKDRKGVVEGVVANTAAVDIRPAGKVYIEGGKFVNLGGWYVIDNHGTLVMSGGTVESTTVASAIRAEFDMDKEDGRDLYTGVDARISITGGKVTAKRLCVKGSYYSDVTISGGVFTSTEYNNVLIYDKGYIVGGQFMSATSANILVGKINDDYPTAGLVVIKGGEFTAPEGQANIALRPEPDYNVGTSVIVTGGVFNQAVPAQFVAPGLAFAKDDTGKYVRIEDDWVIANGGPAGAGFITMRRLVAQKDELEYVKGGIPAPAGFDPVAILSVTAKGGNITAYYDRTVRRIVLYSGNKEVTGKLEDVTLVLIGQ